MHHSKILFDPPPCVCSQTLSCVQLSATPWTVAHQVPLSMGFSRKEYWSGLPCPPPGDLPHPGIKLMSPALAGRFFTISVPPLPQVMEIKTKINKWDQINKENNRQD